MTSSEAELCFLSATAQGELIRSRRLSPVELTRACLDRIERYDPVLRAYITVAAEQALAAARQAEREIAAGDYRGPLHGLVFGAVKPFVPDDAPGWYVASGFAVAFGIAYGLVRHLEANEIYLKI